MPVVGSRRIPRLNSDAQRRAARRGISFKGAGIGAKTEGRYLSALAKILPPLEQIQSLDEADAIVQEWIEFQWEKGIPLGLLGDALCALHFYWQQIKGHLRGSWRRRLFRNWRRLEAPRRAPPMPLQVAKALVGLALECDEVVFGFMIALGFHCYLRTGELLRLSIADISSDGLQGVVRVGSSKSGLRFAIDEAVAIYDKEILQLWELVVVSLPRQEGPLWAHGAGLFRQKFKWFVQALDLCSCELQCYSLRRGGATHHYMTRRIIDSILIRGRWRSLQVASLYLEDGLAHLTSLKLSHTAHSMVDHYSKGFSPQFLLWHQGCVGDRGKALALALAAIATCTPSFFEACHVPFFSCMACHASCCMTINLPKGSERSLGLPSFKVTATSWLEISPSVLGTFENNENGLWQPMI